MRPCILGKFVGLVLVLIFLVFAFPAIGAEIRLSSPVPSLTAGKTPMAVELAEIDADSTLDAVIVGSLTGSTTVPKYSCFHGVGDGIFTGEISQGDLYLSPTDLVVGDFNEDGFLDIAAINGACG